MSGHAKDTSALDAWARSATVEDVLGLVAENQRYAKALERVEKVGCEFGYTGDERDSCACPACETLVIAREALAGDTE